MRVCCSFFSGLRAAAATLPSPASAAGGERRLPLAATPPAGPAAKPKLPPGTPDYIQQAYEYAERKVHARLAAAKAEASASRAAAQQAAAQYAQLLQVSKAAVEQEQQTQQQQAAQLQQQKATFAAQLAAERTGEAERTKAAVERATREAAAAAAAAADLGRRFGEEQLAREQAAAAAAAAEEVAAQLASTIRGLQTQKGQLERKLEAAKTKPRAMPPRTQQAASKQPAEKNTYPRKQAAAQQQELAAARATVAQLRAEVEALTKGKEPPPRTRAPTQPPRSATLIPPRTTDSPDAPFTPRAYEYMRRIVEECNVSFEGASTAISLVLSMFMEAGPSEEQLASSATIKRAFEVLGLIDNDEEKLANQARSSHPSLIMPLALPHAPPSSRPSTGKHAVLGAGLRRRQQGASDRDDRLLHVGCSQEASARAAARGERPVQRSDGTQRPADARQCSRSTRA